VQSDQSSLQPNSVDVSSGDSSPVVAMKGLVARLRREHDKIQDLLSSLSFALRSFNNLNQFLELVPLMASRVTDADGSALVLYRTNGQVELNRLHCQDRHQTGNIREALERATRQTMATIATMSVPASVDGIVTYHRATPVLDHQVTQCLGPNVQLFGTAILVRNVERGRLYVFTQKNNRPWTETQQKLVRLVADQTAVAIANNELAIELRQKERMDRELQIGAEIQDQLLPRQCPKIQGVKLAARCQTANRVGGDYYDFIPVPKGRVRSKQDAANEQSCWGIVIGDVMGKGVPAGLIMTMLRGMLRAEVLNGHSPARILQHLNRVMYTDLENSNRFVTLFYAEYNPKTRMLLFSNAAHHPPLLWQAETQTIRRLDTVGMLIGLDAETEYQDACVQLNPGDTVIYYTDGFTDAADRSGRRFDEDRLLYHFELACQTCDGPGAILDYLFNQIEQFIGPGHAHGDDMTLVVMQLPLSDIAE